MSFWLQKVIVLFPSLSWGSFCHQTFSMWRPSFGPKPSHPNPTDKVVFPLQSTFLAQSQVALAASLCVFSTFTTSSSSFPSSLLEPDLLLTLIFMGNYSDGTWKYKQILFLLFSNHLFFSKANCCQKFFALPKFFICDELFCRIGQNPFWLHSLIYAIAALELYTCFKQKLILNVSTVFIFSEEQPSLGKNYQKQPFKQLNNTPINISVINATDNLTKSGRKQNLLNCNQFLNSRLLPSVSWVLPFCPARQLTFRCASSLPSELLCSAAIPHHHWNNWGCMLPIFLHTWATSPPSVTKQKSLLHPLATCRASSLHSCWAGLFPVNLPFGRDLNSSLVLEGTDVAKCVFLLFLSKPSFLY